MAKRRKTLTKSKVPGFEEISTAQMPDQSGVKLEQLCEEREVGMDGVIHWKDATLEEADIYNPMGWFELDSPYPDKRSPISDLKVISVLSPVKSDTFQDLFKILKADDNHLSLSNIYLGTGRFRYEEPGEEMHDINELNFAFNDITNIGFAARSILF
jgi:hypothetical protein